MTRLALALCACMAGAPATAVSGADEFMAACASCHGETGTGDGPLAELMRLPVPDLTTLRERRGGTFPRLEVMMVIDGRTGIRGHGFPMPVWGDRFDADSTASVGVAREEEVRARIAALTDYIETLQD